MAVVGGREPCPCGSGKRYKACHGRAAPEAVVRRPFAGLLPETEWVALREVVPAATSPLLVRRSEDRDVTLTTVLPFQWPALVRTDGRVVLALQVATRSGDPTRELAAVLLQALAAGPGPVPGPSAADAGGLAPAPDDAPRLVDLLHPVPLEVTVLRSFGHWLDAVPDPEGELPAAVERADAAILPTERVGERSAYRCRIRDREQLRWVLPQEEEPLLDGLARLAVTGALAAGAGSRHIGSYRAHGLLVGVWDLPPGTAAGDLAGQVEALETRLAQVLADSRPLTGVERRARAGLLSRQVTLR